MKRLFKSIWVKRFSKVIFILAIFFACYFAFHNQEISLNKGDSILGTIITSLGIIIAIVTTFIFSKIFSERNERVERKKIIDSYSKKLTSLRRLSHEIQAHSDIIWLNTDPNKLQQQFPKLTLWSYRRSSYDKYKEVREKTGLGEELIQAYLAAKWLEGEKPQKYVINPTFNKNYSLAEIGSYREASIFIYSFLSTFQNDIKLEQLNEYWLKKLEEEIQKINNNKEKLTIKSLYMVFNDAYTDYLVRLYELTQRNRRSVGTSFEGLIIDLVLSVIITGLSVYALTFNMSDNIKIPLIKMSLCGLITIIIDILVNTFLSIRKELIVDEFYE